MDKVMRTSTGIPGLDKMLEGGLPSRTITLLSGSCGSGKSTFAMQFLHYGAKYCNEPGVYVTLEEDPDTLIRNMTLFGWDIEGLMRQKKLLIVKPEVYKFDSIKQIIANAIEKIHAKRLVVDSYSVMLTYFRDPYEVRNGLVQLDRAIRKMSATALVISDITDNSVTFSTTGVEEFIVDGVIVLHLVKDRENPYQYSSRGMTIRKMRATPHSLDLHKFAIGSHGIDIVGHGPHTTEMQMRQPDKHPETHKKRKKKKKEDGRQVDPASVVNVSDLKHGAHHGSSHFGHL